MTPMSVDARRRLEEHLAALQRSIARLGKNVGAAAPRDVLETQAALERIARGTYGRCESCSGAIGRQRLLALPATRYCIACGAKASAVTR
jgi:DnaK suppressor protein